MMTEVPLWATGFTTVGVQTLDDRSSSTSRARRDVVAVSCSIATSPGHMVSARHHFPEVARKRRAGRVFFMTASSGR